MAEILITLGVIGVVAAITIPMLISNYQKKLTVTQLKETYSMFSQAVRLSESENGEVAGWQIESRKNVEFFDTFLAPYLKNFKAKSKANSLVYYTPGGKKETGLAIIRGGAVVYTLLSGVQILVNDGTVIGDQQKDGTFRLSVLIDLNGYNSPPNKFGRDTFFVQINSARGIVFSYLDDGEDSNKYKTREQLKDGPSKFSYQCNKNGRGLWCGALIEKDGWNISRDYPW